MADNGSEAPWSLEAIGEAPKKQVVVWMQENTPAAFQKKFKLVGDAQRVAKSLNKAAIASAYAAALKERNGGSEGDDGAAAEEASSSNVDGAPEEAKGEERAAEATVTAAAASNVDDEDGGSAAQADDAAGDQKPDAEAKAASCGSAWGSSWGWGGSAPVPAAATEATEAEAPADAAEGGGGWGSWGSWAKSTVTAATAATISATSAVTSATLEKTKEYAPTVSSSIKSSLATADAVARGVGGVMANTVTSVGHHIDEVIESDEAAKAAAASNEGDEGADGGDKTAAKDTNNTEKGKGGSEKTKDGATEGGEGVTAASVAKAGATEGSEEGGGGIEIGEMASLRLISAGMSLFEKTATATGGLLTSAVDKSRKTLDATLESHHEKLWNMTSGSVIKTVETSRTVADTVAENVNQETIVGVSKNLALRTTDATKNIVSATSKVTSSVADATSKVADSVAASLLAGIDEDGAGAGRSYPCRELGGRLGIELGGTALPRHPDVDVDEDPLQDRDFLEKVAPVPGSFAAIKRLVEERFVGEVRVVCVATPQVQAKLRRWMHHTGFYDKTGVWRENVHFCREVEDKLDVIAELGITHFVDGDRSVATKIKPLLAAGALVEGSETSMFIVADCSPAGVAGMAVDGVAPGCEVGDIDGDDLPWSDVVKTLLPITEPVAEPVAATGEAGGDDAKEGVEATGETEGEASGNVAGAGETAAGDAE